MKLDEPYLPTLIWNPSLNLKFFEKIEAEDLIRVDLIRVERQGRAYGKGNGRKGGRKTEDGRGRTKREERLGNENG